MDKVEKLFEDAKRAGLHRVGNYGVDSLARITNVRTGRLISSLSYATKDGRFRYLTVQASEKGDEVRPLRARGEDLVIGTRVPYALEFYQTYKWGELRNLLDNKFPQDMPRIFAETFVKAARGGILEVLNEAFKQNAHH